MSNANVRITPKSDFYGDSSAISGSSKINTDLPVSNIIDSIPKKAWRTGGDQTYYRVYAGGDLQNDYMDIKFNAGAEQNLQLTSGEYTAKGLATEIQTQLQTVDVDLTCTYSKSTNKFTIAAGSGDTTQLMTNGGTNAASAIWNDIGFDTSADSSDSNSLEATNKRLHMEEFAQIMFGIVTIRDATTTINSITYNRNDKLNIKEGSTSDELTAIIPPDDYNITDLMTEIEYQLELVGDNNYQVIYDEKTKKVTITSDGDYFSILWETGTNGYDNTQECWYLGILLGLDDTTPTGSSDSTGATSYTLDWPVFPEFSLQTITTASVHEHSLSSSATVDLQLRYAMDRFELDNSLESECNPSDTLTYTGAITTFEIYPGTSLLGYGVVIT